VSLFPSQPPPRELTEALDLVRAEMEPLGREVIYFESIGSTNDVAAALAAEGRHEAVVIADAQTAGRGRRGRSWFSPPGAGLYVSTILLPSRAGADVERATALLTIAAGVALSEAVERTTGLAPAIKWPNDLLVDRRKLAGILAEGVAAPSVPGVQAVVLGYGINVASAAYPPELASRVTDLESELGRPVERSQLCATSLVALSRRYRDLIAGRFDAILDAWRSRAFGSRGARVEWDSPGGVRSGVTDGIDSMGALLVRTGTGVERIVAGEVRWNLHAASH
jgi:BirA family biotin operon repressor/biotin-[acetyl-CoA-carboxylase] ligase